MFLLDFVVKDCPKKHKEDEESNRASKHKSDDATKLFSPQNQHSDDDNQ